MRPKRPKKTITLQNLEAIDKEIFASDLLNMPLTSFESDDIDFLLKLIDASLQEMLGMHSPLQKRTITIRPDNPWNNKVISTDRRNGWRLERR